MSGPFEYAEPDPLIAAPAKPAAKPPPEPTWSQSRGAYFRLGRDDVPFINEQRYNDAYADLIADFSAEAGHNVLPDYGFGNEDGSFTYSEDKIWRDIARIRQRNPGFLKKYARDRTGFEQAARQAELEKSAKATDIASRTGNGIKGWSAWLVGGLTASFTDPINVMTMPLGVGQVGVARKIIGEGLINAATEAVEQPLVAIERNQRGEDLTLEEAAANVGAAFVFGNVFGAGGAGLEKGFDWYKARGGLGPLEKRMGRALSKADPSDIAILGHAIAQDYVQEMPDLNLALTAKQWLGDRLTPDEAAAIATVMRSQEIDQASPYEATPAGDASHRMQLAAEIEARLAETEDRPIKPQASPVPTGVAPAAPIVPSYAPRATVKAAIGRAEYGDGSVYRNPKSSAEGQYQFIDDTWVGLYTRRFGNQGLSRAQIIARKREPSIQSVLMDDLLADNSRMLRRAGQPETAGNLYLAHFAGGNSVKVLRAAPDTPLEQLFSAKAMNANAFMKGRTADWLVNWAARKMGDGAAVRAGDVPVLRQDMFDDEAAWDLAQANETSLAMERIRLDAEEARARADDDFWPVIDRDDYDLTQEISPWDDQISAIDAPSVARLDLPAQADDVAIAPSGEERRVRYAVVEASALQASHDDVGRVNADYPPLLQPRDRSRGVSQAQVADIAARLDPRLLGRSPKASDGAPIVSDSGLAVSGNGRILAIRRAYAEGGEAAARYRAFVNEAHPEAADMEQPVLVRVLDRDMSEDDLIDFARAANTRDTAGFSATEQALTDATMIDGDMLDLFRPGGLDLPANRDFVRRFLKSAVSPTEYNSMVTADGFPSAAGYQRIQAAMLAKAYGQSSMVAEIVEATDTNIKAIGQALADASGRWAQMVTSVQRGAIAPEMDITTHLNEAVALIQKSRADRVALSDLVDQREMFSGNAVSPITEAMLRLFYANEDLTKALGRDRLAKALDFYAEEALKSQPGGGLFGDFLRANPEAVLSLARERQFDGQADFFDQPTGDPRGRQSSAGEELADGEGEGLSRGPGQGPGGAPGWIDQETLRQWDDPVGEGAQLQSDSLEHDARMAADTAAEDPANEMLFSLDGEEPKSAKQIFDEIDREGREADAVRQCAAPPKPQGDA